MADDVTFQPTVATPPSGTKVATDDVGGVHYQRMKLVDGTDGASTAAKVSSEGNLQVTGVDRTASGTVDALDEAVTLNAEGLASVSIGITTTALTATVLFEVLDGSGVWIRHHMQQLESAAFFVSSLLWEQDFAAFTGTQHWGAEVGAFDSVRIRISAYTSGSAVVSLIGSPATAPQQVVTIADPTGQPFYGKGLTGALTVHPLDGTGDSMTDDANNALRVNVVAGAAGGTQYTEADTDASITGTALLWEDAADTLRAVSAAKPLPIGDAGGSITVDAASLPLPTGASTAALQTQPGVDIGDVTVNNGAGASAVNIQDGGNAITVDGTVAVTGVSTAANQTTELASLAAIESDADAIRIAAQLIDDPVQVLGTDTYTEATSKGTTLGAVRRDADTSLVNTTNEFAPLQVDALGRLKVEAFSGEALPVTLTSTTVTGTVAVTQSGTWDEVGINDSGNSITVDQPTGTNLHTVVDTLPALVAGSANIGDVDVLTVPADPFGVNADAASATGSVSAKLRFIAATGIPVTSLPALVAGSANIGDVDVLTVPSPLSTAGNGTAATAHRVTLASDSTGQVALAAGSANIGDVDVLTVPAPLSTTGGGTEATALRVTVASNSTGLLPVDGNVASDIPVTANPLLDGGRASLAVPTAVSADGDAVALWLDRTGRTVVRNSAGTSAQTSVASSASSVTVLAANTSRLGATVWNDSTQLLYLKMGATASTTSFSVRMASQSYYEVPFGYTGILDGIWASANGNARVTELT